jgi:hypothetical protein
MNLLKNFLSRVGQIVLVFTVTYITPAVISSIVTFDMSRYFAMLNSNAYIGIMSFVSIVVSFIFCAYLIESIENN